MDARKEFDKARQRQKLEQLGRGSNSTASADAMITRILQSNPSTSIDNPRFSIQPPTNWGYPGLIMQPNVQRASVPTQLSVASLAMPPHQPNMTQPQIRSHQLPTMVMFPPTYLPVWALQEAMVPEFYRHCLHQVSPQPTTEPDTSLVYQLLLSSDLPRDVLSYIWSMVNRTLPGRLSKQEFYGALALVALAQQNQGTFPTIEMLLKLKNPPIPRLSAPFLRSQTPTQFKPVPPAVPNSISDGSLKVSGNKEQPDEFGDFAAAATSVANVVPVESDVRKNDKKPLSEDLMLPDSAMDPYAALRSLENPEPTIPTLQPLKPQPIPSSKPPDQTISAARVNQSDDFGEFVENRESKIPNQQSLDHHLASIPSALNGNFFPDKFTHQPNNPEILKNGQLSLAAEEDWPEDTSSLPGSSSTQDVDSVRSLDLKVSNVPQTEGGQGGFMETFDLIGVGDTKPPGRVNSFPNALLNKYDAARLDSPEGVCAEVHLKSWTNSVEACCMLVQEACNTFSNNAPDVVRELLLTEKGKLYLKGLCEVYQVAVRIRLSCNANAIATHQLSKMLESMEESWKKLTTIDVVAELLPDIGSFHCCVIRAKALDEIQGDTSPCGLCMLNVLCSSDAHPRPPRLDYAGRAYHAPCANFWVNCVDPLLPGLVLQGLL